MRVRTRALVRGLWGGMEGVNTPLELSLPPQHPWGCLVSRARKANEASVETATQRARDVRLVFARDHDNVHNVERRPQLER